MTMTRYRRLPAILVLVAVVAIGWTFFAPRPAAQATGLADSLSLDDLRSAIADGDTSPDVWYAYGRRLMQANQFVPAAQAFAEVLSRMPYHRPARFDRALALAQSGDRDAFFAFLAEIVYSEPKLAVELLGRPEVASLSADPRMEPLRREARSQAMD